MTLGTFQAVKFGGSKGGPGASAASRGGSGCHGASVASWGGSGVRALEDGSGKEGEPKASGAGRGGAGRQRRPYTYHRQSFESATYVQGRYSL